MDKPVKYVDVENIYGLIFPPENRIVLILTYVTSKYTRRSEDMYRRYAEIAEALGRNI